MITDLIDFSGIRLKQALRVIGMSASSWYYKPNNLKVDRQKFQNLRAIPPEMRFKILNIMNSSQYLDKSPAQIFANLLDKGLYYCSIRTLYRILSENRQVKERRNQRKHPVYKKPELLATAPNQLWSWDITKLKGPQKWTYFYLYVILDVFSRYVVGWMVGHRETAVLAKKLIGETIQKYNIPQGQLTIHADRGSSMKSKPVALLLSDLGVIKSHSRPHVSNDNPYSESQFKTLKYRPNFPRYFGGLEDARFFMQDFFPWYNNEHYHSSLALLTPHDVHYGKAKEKLLARNQVLIEAYRQHPERFIAGEPKMVEFQNEVWINKPDQKNIDLGGSY